MTIRDLMTTHPAHCGPANTVREAARLMDEHDCGSLPVIDNGKLVGMVTDRDLAVRCLARGMGANTPVRKVMSLEPISLTPEDDLDRAVETMAERQVRRLPVVNDEGRVVGMLAQADLALSEGDVSDSLTGQMVEKISRPMAAVHA